MEDLDKEIEKHKSLVAAGVGGAVRRPSNMVLPDHRVTAARTLVGLHHFNKGIPRRERVTFRAAAWGKAIKAGGRWRGQKPPVGEARVRAAGSHPGPTSTVFHDIHDVGLKEV